MGDGAVELNNYLARVHSHAGFKRLTEEPFIAGSHLFRTIMLMTLRMHVYISGVQTSITHLQCDHIDSKPAPLQLL